MDPIEEISILARSTDVPCHVDACLGGFLLAFAPETALKFGPGRGDWPSFDFRLAGVTSMSADTHKFGYAPKGSSVILYRSGSLLRHQFYVSTDWTGGVFASPTLAGSRSGGIVAATWASMVHHGRDGYVEMARKVIETLQFITEGYITLIN